MKLKLGRKFWLAAGVTILLFNCLVTHFLSQENFVRLLEFTLGWYLSMNVAHAGVVAGADAVKTGLEAKKIKET